MPVDAPFAASEPEYLDGAGRPRRERRRAPLVALAAIGVVGVVAAGGWAALSLMSTGEPAATAVPADAVAYVSLDLDPSAAQKLEALRIVEKFPALDEELGLDARDDLRRWAFEEITTDACPALDYDGAVAPWIGDRAAVAVLPPREPGGDPIPMVALQITDADAAAASLDELAHCAVAGDPATDDGSGDVGYAFAGDYVVLAETTGTAEEIAVAAGSAALADDEAFLRWTGEVGDPGFVTMYVAPTVVDVLADVQRHLAGELGGDPGIGPGPGYGLLSGPGFGPGGAERFEEMAADFEGMAAVLRFRDGAAEVELAGGGLHESLRPAAGATTGVEALPDTTGAAFAIALPEGWAADFTASMDETADGMIEQMEARTGLELPEDLERLLGESVSLAVDASLDPGAVGALDLAAVPVGVRVEGDPEETMAVVEKIRAAWGAGSEALVAQAGDGVVALGTDAEYVDLLVGTGDLGGAESFRAVVPEADRVGGVVYVDFDAGDAWLERVVSDLARATTGKTGDEVHRNMEALDALGFSSWQDGDVSRGLFRLTTD